MPNWSPNWTDVRWDHAAASSLTTALNQAAVAIESGTNERIRQAHAAVEAWAGTYRTTFDDYLNRVLKAGGELAETCRRTAQSITNASQMASDEQSRRIHDRQRWEDEKNQAEREQRNRSDGAHIPV